LAYALADGQELEKSIHFANAVAAYSVTKMGAQSSMPTKKDLEPFALNTL
jgi:ribokinase